MRGGQGDHAAKGVEVDVEPLLPRQHRRHPDVAVQGGPSDSGTLLVVDILHRINFLYRVGLVVWQLGWVDLDLECSTILLGQ